MRKKKNNWDKIKNTRNIEAKLKTFQKMVYENKGCSNRKIHFLMLRLLKLGLKDYKVKPLMVLYLTPEIQRQTIREGCQFLDQIRKNVNDQYYVLAIPSYDDKCKLEVWNKGSLKPKVSTEILKKIVDPYQNVSFSEQANRGIRQAMMEMGLL